MKLQVRLFAAAQQAVGRRQVAVTLEEDEATVGRLRAALVCQYPSLAPWVPHLLVAVDRQYASDAQAVSPESEIACFPPVSGG